MPFMLPGQPEPRWFTRVVLALNVTLLGIQLAQFQPDLLATPAHWRGLVALSALVVLAVLPLVASLVAYRWLAGWAGRFVEWVLAERIRVWGAAFVAFQLCVLTGLAIDRHAIFPRGSELLGAVGFLDAVTILLAWQPLRPSLTAEENDSPPHIPDRVIGLGVAAAGLLASAAIWLYAPPLAYGNLDSYRNFYSSEGILGRQPLDLFWYTYPYPLLITATRLIADTLLSIIVLQHLLRIVTAFLIFWWLRGANRLAAAIAAFLVALSPINAFNAHQLLDASIYSTGITLIVLLTYRAAQPDWKVGPGALIAIGVLCGWVAFMRPLGQLLILPTLLVVILYARSWLRPAWIVGGLMAASLALMAGQWLIDGRFRFGTDEEAFYIFPTIYLGLFDPANGPVAQSFQTMLDSGECDYTLPDPSWQIAHHWPHRLHNCAVAYNEAHGTNLSSRALYLEAIWAKPTRYIAALFRESRLFLTHSDTGPIQEGHNRLDRMPFFQQTWSPVDGCRGERPQYTDLALIDSWLTYTCTYPARQSILTGLVQSSYDAALVAMQPYRLEGRTAWGRFWAALALLAFVLIEGLPRQRALAILCALFIAYHALVSTAAMFPQPRYVYFNLPLFFIIVSLAVARLWEGIRALRSRVEQIVVGGVIVLLPFLPGLFDSLWVDTAWTGRYYANRELRGSPALVRQDAVITFDWGEAGPYPEGGRKDDFSVRWERTDLFEAGIYTFAVRSDDGVRLYVDGELILDLWSEGFHDWAAVDREMTAGRHRLRIEYFEATGPAAVQAGYYPKESP